MDRVIFVVGARRSGTNWLQRMLCSHPDLAGVPSESFLFSHGIEPLAERFQSAATGSPATGFVYMERHALADALRDFCDAVFLGIRDSVRPAATRIVERTPDHVRFLPLIGEVYPDARVIHIIRDGRDVARSLLGQEWGPDSVAEAAEEWRSAIEQGRTSGSTLGHYREVRYEALLEDTAGELVQLYSWLGVPVDDEIMEVAVAEGRARFNVDPSAPRVAAGKWQGSFTEEDLWAFEAVAGNLLGELGYAPGSARPREAARGPIRAPAQPRLANRLRSAAKSMIRGRGARPSVGVATATLVQSVVDGFLARIADRHFEEAASMLRPAAMVRIVGPKGDWRGRGEPARRRLVEALSADRALAGKQVRADIHPAVPLVTVFASYELPAGGNEHRVLVVGADRAAVTHVTFYDPSPRSREP